MKELIKKNTIFNLKTARGQIDGIIKMVEEDRYCIDVSKQILSAQSLLKKANLAILRGHIKTCLADAIENGDAADRIEEIFDIIDKSKQDN